MIKDCGCREKGVFDCGRSDDEHTIVDLQNDFLIILELLDKNTKDGYPQDVDTGECYYCEYGTLDEDDRDDVCDHLESPSKHKESCIWRRARDIFDEKKTKDALMARK